VNNPKNKTNLQHILDDIGITQAQLALLSGLEKYQVSLIASGTRPDCYISTAKKICKALSKICKQRITLNDVFGDKPVSRKLRKKSKKDQSELDSNSQPPNTPSE